MVFLFTADQFALTVIVVSSLISSYSKEPVQLDVSVATQFVAAEVQRTVSVPSSDRVATRVPTLMPSSYISKVIFPKSPIVPCKTSERCRLEALSSRVDTVVV